jgi:NAD-dependent deacetylase
LAAAGADGRIGAEERMTGSRQLRELVAASERLVAFTGAGISAESGIPTYRGEGGVWNRYDPGKYANIDYFMQDPSYYWNFFRDVRYPVLKRAHPNPAHRALAELETRGSLGSLITQNIDGLHQEAGSSNVLELHGNTRRIVCLDCGRKHTLDEVYELTGKSLPPVCTACSGRLKPDVVFFGEALPEAVLAQAVEDSQDCDLFLVVGSSLVVQPAATLPALAARGGAKLVIVNKGPTPLDSIADLVLNDAASEVLGGLLP